MAAGDIEGNHDAIARCNVMDICPDFLADAHALVAEYISGSVSTLTFALPCHVSARVIVALLLRPSAAVACNLSGGLCPAAGYLQTRREVKRMRGHPRAADRLAEPAARVSVERRTALQSTCGQYSSPGSAAGLWRWRMRYLSKIEIGGRADLIGSEDGV